MNSLVGKKPHKINGLSVRAKKIQTESVAQAQHGAENETQPCICLTDSSYTLIDKRWEFLSVLEVHSRDYLSVPAETLPKSKDV